MAVRRLFLLDATGRVLGQFATPGRAHRRAHAYAAQPGVEVPLTVVDSSWDVRRLVWVGRCELAIGDGRGLTSCTPAHHVVG